MDPSPEKTKAISTSNFESKTWKLNEQERNRPCNLKMSV